MQPILIFLAQRLHAAASRGKMQRLFRNQRFRLLLDLAHWAHQPLAQLHLHPGFHLLDVCAVLHAANEVEPLQFGSIPDHKRINLRLARYWEPERRRIALNLLAVITRWSYADHSIWLPVDIEARSNDRRIQPVLLLPGAKAHHYNRSSASLIIRGLQQPSGICADSKGVEGIPGNNLAVEAFRRMIAPLAAHTDLAPTGLKRRHLLELRIIVPKHLVLVIGEERPIIPHAAVDAAVLLIAYAPQLIRVHHRQRLQQHRMHQRKDGGRRTNAKRERQNRRCGKPWNLAKLPQRVPNIFKNCPHESPYGVNESIVPLSTKL